MLDDVHGDDLAGLVNIDGNLHRLEAHHVINGSSSFLGGSSGRSSSSGSLERVVDAIGGEGHAGLHVDLSGSDVLTDQSVKTSVDEIGAEARSLVVLDDVHGDDLAGLVNIDGNLHRLEAQDVIDIAGSSRSSLGNLSSRRLSDFNRDAIGSGGLLERISDRIGGHGHAGLDIDLSSRNVLTNQIGKRFLGEDISAKARGLAVNRRVDRSDHTILDSDVHGELAEALDGIRIGRDLRTGSLQSGVDGLGGHRHASLHIDGGTRDILTDQRVKAGVDEIGAKARGLIVLDNLDGDDLASVIDRNLDLHRTEAVDVVGVGGHDRLGIAGSGSGGGQNGFLIARSRCNAQGVLRIGKDLGNGANKRGRRHRRAADGIDVVIQGIRIGGNGDKLILEVRLGNLGAQTGGLLKSADVGLSDMAFGADADRDRDRSAVALRSSGQRIADGRAGGILRLEDLIQRAALGETFIFDLSVFAAREHSVERVHLGGELLSLDRALGHFIGQRQRDSSHESEDEETKRELKNVTHYFLTSPKLLLPVTRSISGDTTFISRMAKEHHSAGVFLQQRKTNRSRPQPRPKMILPFVVAGEVE